MKILGFVPVVLLAFPVTVCFSQELFEDQILESNGTSMFGSALASDSETLVVGSPFEDDDVGSVFVYEFSRATGEWSEVAELTGDVGEDGENDRFGSALAVENDLIVVGAYQDSEETVAAGSVFFFRYDEDLEAWEEVQKFIPDDAESYDNFGRSVSVHGGFVAVGAPGDDENGLRSGAVYVLQYDEDEDEWVESQVVRPSDGAARAYFGFTALSLTEDYLVVAAAGDTENGAYSGAVYVFTYDETTEEWGDEVKLTPDDAEGYDRFGTSVAVSGDLVAVGARGYEVGEGAVYLFEFDSVTDAWEQVQTLVAEDADDGDEFGISVAIADSRMCIGARYDDEVSRDRGAAYVFSWDPDGEAWEQGQKLTPDTEYADWFGGAVAFADDQVAVGCADDDPENVAACYLFGPIVFLRGDVDGSGSVSALVDALAALEWAFVDGDEPPCFDAADVDNNGEFSALLDSLFLLQWAFDDGDVPPAPGPNECGNDPESDTDDLGCAESGACA